MAAISLGSHVFNPGVSLADANGKAVAINQRGLAILEVLLSSHGNTVSKSELMDRFWPGQIVEEGNLTVQMAALRKLLGERPDGSEWIITVPLWVTGWWLRSRPQFPLQPSKPRHHCQNSQHWPYCHSRI